METTSTELAGLDRANVYLAVQSGLLDADTGTRLLLSLDRRRRQRRQGWSPTDGQAAGDGTHERAISPAS